MTRFHAPLRIAINQIRALRSFHGIIRDPGRLDLVLDLTRSASDLIPVRTLPPALQAYVEAGQRTPVIDLAPLRGLPEGTLGRAFAEHMDRMGFSGADLEHALPQNPALAQISEHLQRTHDVHHVLTGYATDIPGEIGLQAFYLSNFRSLPSQAILAAVLLRPLVLQEGGEQAEAVMDALAEGWLRGKSARCLFGVDWSAHWHRPLTDVQAEFGLRGA